MMLLFNLSSSIFLLCCLFLLTTTWATSSTSAANVKVVVVSTPSGQLQGFANLDLNLSYFYNVPYAEKVVKRFTQSQLKKPWSGVLDCTTPGLACLQNGPDFPPDRIGEDCLNLNIHTPYNVSGPFPVMVWVHGGSFTHGSGFQYDATRLAMEGVIVVTINYRLGPMGFLQNEQIRQENPTQPTLGALNGVMDQVLALTWVKQNIVAFGGDPNKVTIFGESAGSLSLCALLAIPQANGLYQNVIIESGSCIGPWGPKPSANGLQLSNAFLSSLNVTTIDELRMLDATVLLASPNWNTISPSIDEYFITQPLFNLYEAGAIGLPATGSLLIGANNLDTLFGFPWYNGPFPQNATSYQNLLGNYFGADTTSVLAVYPPLPSPKIAYQQMIAHLCLICPTKLLSDIVSEKWLLFLYEFSFNPNPDLLNYAGHFSEVPLVFGGQVNPWPYDEQLSTKMREYWTSFASKGAPTSSSAGVTWPPYEADGAYLELNLQISQNFKYYQEKCGFWEKYQLGGYDKIVKVTEFCFQRLL